MACPLCKTIANFTLPLAQSGQKNCSQTLYQLCQNKVDVVYPELLKSFYHMAILGYIDPQNLKTKKMGLYQNLFKTMSYAVD
jgi:hypothetical protein